MQVTPENPVQTFPVRKYSPQLDKIFKDLGPSADINLLQGCFKHAIAAGGLLEHDFEREDGVSYNPRPARVVYILVKNCGITDSLTLAAGMLASVYSEQGIELPPELPRVPLMQLVNQSQLAADKLLTEQTIPQAAVIACAVRLDRARHIHLSSMSESALAAFHEETANYLEVARRYTPPLEPLLAAIGNRFQRKYRKSSHQGNV